MHHNIPDTFFKRYLSLPSNHQDIVLSLLLLRPYCSGIFHPKLKTGKECHLPVFTHVCVTWMFVFIRLWSAGPSDWSRPVQSSLIGCIRARRIVISTPSATCAHRWKISVLPAAGNGINWPGLFFLNTHTWTDTQRPSGDLKGGTARNELWTIRKRKMIAFD